MGPYWNERTERVHVMAPAGGHGGGVTGGADRPATPKEHNDYVDKQIALLKTHIGIWEERKIG
jgi:hypothetical protein